MFGEKKTLTSAISPQRLIRIPDTDEKARPPVGVGGGEAEFQQREDAEILGFQVFFLLMRKTHPVLGSRVAGDGIGEARHMSVFEPQTLIGESTGVLFDQGGAWVEISLNRRRLRQRLEGRRNAKRPVARLSPRSTWSRWR